MQYSLFESLFFSICEALFVILVSYYGIDKESERRIIIVESSFKGNEQKMQELVEMHGNRLRKIKLRQFQEEVALEKELEGEKIEIMENYFKRR